MDSAGAGVLLHVRQSIFLACNLMFYYLFMSQSHNFAVIKREGVGMCFEYKLTLELVGYLLFSFMKTLTPFFVSLCHFSLKLHDVGGRVRLVVFKKLYYIYNTCYLPP